MPPSRGLVSGIDAVVPDASSVYVSGLMEIAAGRVFEVRAGGFLEIG